MLSPYEMLQSHGLQHASLTFASLYSKFAQTHVYWVGDAIQPSHPLLPRSPPNLNLSSIRVFSNEAKGLLGSSYQVAKVLEL